MTARTRRNELLFLWLVLALSLAPLREPSWWYSGLRLALWAACLLGAYRTLGGVATALLALTWWALASALLPAEPSTTAWIIAGLSIGAAVPAALGAWRRFRSRARAVTFDA